ncbi:hypothetical protein INR49_008881 [Caranx melampygus]|nr:hypothetical protein INR49_008881 [Caranx melampygus]
MSCHHLSYSSLTCELSQESNSLDITLVFRSRNKIFSCKHIFNPSAVLKVTARVWDYVTRTEVWSQPHTVVLYQAVKASQPVLSVLGFTDDSVNVSWTSSVDGSCRLRYRASDTGIWSQPAGLVAVRGNQVSVQTITGLLPLTTYTAAVACRRGESGIWSSWSLDVTVTTLERAPSRPPEVCYRVEGAASRRPQLLHLSFWKGPDHETRGRVLGYQVSHEPAVRQCLQDRMILNATEVTAPLVVEEGNCSVTVTAFNTAGAGPAAQLSVDTHAHGLSSVRNLWISSSLPDARALNVQWESPAAPTATPTAPPVSHFVVRWQSERRPSTSCWSTVDSVNTSTHIPDVDPDESYLVSVFPVYKQQLCGAVQSLPATLQQGALMEVVGLKVVALTKTLVTVEWAWQRASRGPIRVNRYEVMLQERQKTVGVVTVWPDQSQHSFTNLKPDTEYSLLLLADDFPRATSPSGHESMKSCWWRRRLLCCCCSSPCSSPASCPGLCTGPTSSPGSPARGAAPRAAGSWTRSTSLSVRNAMSGSSWTSGTSR